MSAETQSKKTQLDDIAAELGVSKSTVSRAISGKGRIGPETRKRVLEYIKQRNYHPNIIAKGLSESKTYNIGVIIPPDSGNASAPFFQTCLTGICRSCAARDYNAIVINAGIEDLSQLVRAVENKKVDGIIITRPVQDGSMEKYLIENGMPFVVVGKSEMKGVACIDSSHLEGCKELTAYLLRSNPCDKIALIMSNMEHTVNKSRYAGFISAFEDVGKSPADGMVYTEADSTVKLEKCISELLRREPSCIICGDDIICIKLLAELNNAGKNVPGDIKVASFYDSDYLDNYSPPITSLVFNAEELGANAASMLFDVMSGKNTEKNAMLSFEMRIRKSTI